MSFHNLSISVLKVGRQLAVNSVVAAFFCSFFSLSSCIKEEAAVIPIKSGDVTTRTIAMEQGYKFQNFYNLEKDSVISRNPKWDWDIAFDASAEGTHAYINGARFMFSWKTESQNLMELKDTFGFYNARRWEAVNTPDTVTIGSVKNNPNVYWIDRGYDDSGEQTGFVKIQFESVDNQKYSFKITRRESPNQIESYEISKDPNYNLVYFSFTKNKRMDIEPRKFDWDLQFTQYMFTFFDPYTPYIVTGVLLNPYHTLAAVDSTTGFSRIDRALAQNMKLKNNPDVIGYNWKGFSLSDQSYSINSHYTYVIRDAKGFYYKLRFIGFFDAVGRRGFPKFEYQRL